MPRHVMSKRWVVRVPTSLHEQVDTEARRRGMNRSEFIKWAVREACVQFVRTPAHNQPQHQGDTPETPTNTTTST